MSMKNVIDTIGNRSRDLPVCSTVPQPLRHQQRAPIYSPKKLNKIQQSIFKTKRTYPAIIFRGKVTSLETDRACCNTPGTPRACGGCNQIWFLNLSRQDLSYHYLTTPFSWTDFPVLNSAEILRLPSSVPGVTGLPAWMSQVPRYRPSQWWPQIQKHRELWAGIAQSV
jgi:hypothetical protein